MSGFPPIVVSTVVPAEPGRAFEIFTEEIDRWWRRGPRFRWNPAGADDGVLGFEPGIGGRLVERYDDPAAEDFEVGRVLRWEPGEWLRFEFRARSFAPGERTEVEVRFDADAGGTRVTVEHTGWDAFAEDHPVRRGLKDALSFANVMRAWWGDLALSLQHLTKGTFLPN